MLSTGHFGQEGTPLRLEWILIDVVCLADWNVGTRREDEKAWDVV
jgi:hypothetical protein